MGKIKLFIAVSIDGFIAREDGSIGWLEDIENPDRSDHGYKKFYDAIGTVVIGRKTYEQIIGFGVPWPYADRKTYLITSNKDYKISTENTEIFTEIDTRLIETLRSKEEKDVWPVGGGEIITRFIKERAIDEMILSIVPRLLGRGIRLFHEDSLDTLFELVDSESFSSGIVNLTYRKKKNQI
jgi:dihydrofolate reductase